MTYEINLQTYAKLLMHSLKYPYAKVNGILLSKKQKSTESKTTDSSPVKSDDKNHIEFIDYIPLFHFNQGNSAN